MFQRQSVGLVCLFLLAAGVSGCRQPYFMTELDYIHYNRISTSYDREQYDRGIEELAAIAPRTVKDPGRGERWEVTLSDIKRMALEYNKQIALLRYSPAIDDTRIDSELASFDAVFEAGGAWERTDEQAAGRLEVYGTDRDSFTEDLFGGSAGFGTNQTGGAQTDSSGQSAPTVAGPNMLQVHKRNAAGGITSLGYRIDYERNDPVTTFTGVNPYWRSSMELTLQQPLLQGAGVEFNRASILVARTNHEQAIRSFELNIQQLLRDVELAYWQLYFSYQDLYSRQFGVERAQLTWQSEKNKQVIGTAAPPDVAQAREQLETFHAAYLEALSRVLAAERNLRELLGLAPDDGRQLVPADTPSIAEYIPNWQVAVAEALELRPELAAQRQQIRAYELELFRQKNGLLPDLTFAAQYTITGLADEYDGSVDQLTDNDYNDWYLGIRYRRPIGERAANAAVRRAQLQLDQARAEFKNAQHTAMHELAEAYREIVFAYRLIQTQKDRAEAAARNLEAQQEFYKAGRTSLDILLEAQTIFADALRDEGQAITQYNQALIRWEFAKGTILQNDNVTLAEQLLAKPNNCLAERRRCQWMHALALPIHVGSPGDCTDDEPETPLYSPVPHEPEAIPEAEPSPTQEEPAPEQGPRILPELPKVSDLQKADDGSDASGSTPGSGPAEAEAKE